MDKVHHMSLLRQKFATPINRKTIKQLIEHHKTHSVDCWKSRTCFRYLSSRRFIVQAVAFIQK